MCYSPAMSRHPQQFGILTRARSDALPEHAQYRDDGCDVHPHCLTCPLPRCRYDEPGGLRSVLIAGRDQDSAPAVKLFRSFLFSGHD